MKPQRVRKYWPLFLKSGLAFDLDPFVVAGICDHESLCGLTLNPEGPAGKGDNGHGHGLMQVDDRSHKAWLEQLGPDGVPLWQDPEANILKGSSILAQARDFFRTSPKVPGVTQLDPLVMGIAAYNAGTRRVARAVELLTQPAKEETLLDAINWVTSGHSYVTDVQRRAAEFAAENVVSPPLKAKGTT